MAKCVSASSALLDAIARIEVEVPVIAARTLITLACDAYNEDVAYDERVSEHADPDVLAKIQIAYVRQYLVEFDSGLEERVERSGDPAAQSALQAQILAAIADAYPDLAEACASLAQSPCALGSDG